MNPLTASVSAPTPIPERPTFYTLLHYSGTDGWFDVGTHKELHRIRDWQKNRPGSVVATIPGTTTPPPKELHAPFHNHERKGIARMNTIDKDARGAIQLLAAEITSIRRRCGLYVDNHEALMLQIGQVLSLPGSSPESKDSEALKWGCGIVKRTDGWWDVMSADGKWFYANASGGSWQAATDDDFDPACGEWRSYSTALAALNACQTPPPDYKPSDPKPSGEGGEGWMGDVVPPSDTEKPCERCGYTDTKPIPWPEDLSTLVNRHIVTRHRVDGDVVAGVVEAVYFIERGRPARIRKDTGGICTVTLMACDLLSISDPQTPSTKPEKGEPKPQPSTEGRVRCFRHATGFEFGLDRIRFRGEKAETVYSNGRGPRPATDTIAQAERFVADGRWVECADTNFIPLSPPKGEPATGEWLPEGMRAVPESFPSELSSGMVTRWSNDRDSLWRAAYTKLEAERDEARKLHHELLYQVGNVHPGETRHQTALRYIKQAENGPSGEAQQPKRP